MVSCSCYHPQSPIKPHEPPQTPCPRKAWRSEAIARQRIRRYVRLWVISLRDVWLFFFADELRLFLNWLINSSVHQKASAARFKLFPGVAAAAHQSFFRPEWCQASPHLPRYPRILWAKLLPMRCPAAFYSQSWTETEKHTTHNHSQWLCGGPHCRSGVSHGTTCKQNTVGGVQAKIDAALDLN